MDQGQRREADQVRRHLLYHILPVANNGTWQRNLDQLRVRLPLFDGRKVIAICQADGNVIRDETTNRGRFELDPPGAVMEYLEGTGCEFLTVENDPTLREVKTWPALWSRLAEFADTSDVVFYAHAKGVTRPRRLELNDLWTRILYASLLDYWPLVQEALSDHPVAGSFKRVGCPTQGSRAAWVYAGGFYWCRVFEALRWASNIESEWYGSESWPGLHFDGACIFHDGDIGTLQPGEWAAWTKANAGRQTNVQL